MDKISNKKNRIYYPYDKYTAKLNLIIDKANGERTADVKKLDNDNFINNKANKVIVDGINNLIDGEDVKINDKMFNNNLDKVVVNKINEIADGSEPVVHVPHMIEFWADRECTKRPDLSTDKYVYMMLNKRLIEIPQFETKYDKYVFIQERWWNHFFDKTVSDDNDVVNFEFHAQLDEDWEAPTPQVIMNCYYTITINGVYFRTRGMYDSGSADDTSPSLDFVLNETGCIADWIDKGIDVDDDNGLVLISNKKQVLQQMFDNGIYWIGPELEQQ